MLNRWSLAEEKRRWPPSLWKQLRPFQRIVIVGASGSGKSTLARALSEEFALPHVELDAFQHGPSWAQASAPVFRAKLEKTLGERWVVDGNYAAVRDLVWPKAQALVWINESFTRTFSRLLRRTISRSWQKKELWNGNRENWKMSFFSRDSVLLWGWKTYGSHRRRFEALYKEGAGAHLAWFEIRKGRWKKRD